MGGFAPALLSIMGLALAGPVPARAEPPLVWIPKAITCKVSYDNKYRNMGKYLYLKQKPPRGSGGWTQSKVDVPDDWQIQKTYFSGDSLIIQISEYDRYYLSPRNWRAMQQGLLYLKARDNQHVQEVWDAHGRAGT